MKRTVWGHFIRLGRPARLALVLAVALLAGACGGDDDSDDPAATTKTYLNALADRDGAKACDQFTDELRRKTLAYFKSRYPERRFASCADGLDFLAENTVNGEAESALREAKIKTTSVDGDSATVTVGKSRAGRLTRIDGRWLISGGVLPG